MKGLAGVLGGAFILILLLAPQVKAQDHQAPPQSPQSFVQSFYDWYVALTSDPTDFALKHKGEVFSPALLRALKGYYETEAESSWQTVGLDFDPVLNTQEPCQRYEAGKSIKKVGIHWVEVHATCSGKKSETPDVVAGLVLDGGKWKFLNFQYPNLLKDSPKSADLLSILKEIADDRRRERNK